VLVADTWRSFILCDLGIGEQYRMRRLDVIGVYHIRLDLRITLLHVTGARAKNQFEVVRDLFDPPTYSAAAQFRRRTIPIRESGG